jgi:hypothetical protein
MIIIKRCRNKGKTTELVKLLTQTPEAILLVHGSMEAHRILHEFDLPEEYNLRIIPWNNFNPHGAGTPVLIDNVDLFLQERFCMRIAGVSINED